MPGLYVLTNTRRYYTVNVFMHNHFFIFRTYRFKDLVDELA